MIRAAASQNISETTDGGRGDLTDTIVVGVDGSQGSQQALRWAAEEARYRHARLHVVLAWEPPTQIVGGMGWIVPNAEMLAKYDERARERLDQALAPLGDELEGIEIERSTVHGAPAAVLLEVAKGANELVVGTRGRGGFVGLLLGSVSLQCSHHAPCPVVIVPPAQ
jgi:nucleotide-binding universal stress UspA family protein